MEKNQLLKGTKFVFDNERFQIAIKNDDVRSAICYFNKKIFVGYKIWFNGKIIHSSKTYEPFKNRFEKLQKDWHLELNNFIEENEY